jgi:UDP-N-acetylmuramoylalanine--D-glutamate ligase
MAETMIAMDVQGKRVLVVGLGKSGVASALFLQSRGARVTVSDTRTQQQLHKEIPTLLDLGIAIETGGHGERTFHDQDLIVVSPGVPTDVPQLVKARTLGLPVIGEIELASRFLRGKIVAITGSNGKTTTTTLCGELIAASGRPVLVGGNIGTPVIQFVDESTANTVNVLEVSSFQLETIESFHPHIAVILNITPDHLDRHGSFQAYADAKARIFLNQTSSDWAVLNLDNSVTAGLAARSRAAACWFTRKALRGGDVPGAFVRDSGIFWRDGGGESEIMPVGEIPLKGAHNLENVLAAICVARLAGCNAEDIRRGVRQFKAVEHRLQLIAKIDGVEYYNDSKATNVDATVKAIESFPGNIHLILGGKDKDSDYSTMNDLLRQRVRRVYTIGSAAEKIKGHVAAAVEVMPCVTLDVAVQKAADLAAPGDVVLLAPACSSFDQFENYEHRGRVFRTLVQALAERKATVGSERR